MIARLPLSGGGGEPVDLIRTIVSHGVVELPPNRLDEKAGVLESTLPVAGGARTVRISRAGKHARVDLVAGRAGERARTTLRETVRHMLRLDEDMAPFYEVARDDPDLAWAAGGAGRMLRAPTVFEDVVKTICTTNCAWSATRRMTAAIVENLGTEAPGGARSFPSPAAMAEAGEKFYREVARAGYRGAYLHGLAVAVAEGADLDQLNDPELPDDAVAAKLLELPGIGPYGAAHVMLTSLGRYSRLVLDSWSRPKYQRVAGSRRTLTDRTIERRFKRYGPWAGLAFWLFVTRDWAQDAQAPPR